MTPTNFESWENVKNLLQSVINILNEDLPVEDKVALQTFVDNNEFGVAFDWIEGVIEEDSLILDSKTSKIMEDIRRIIST